MNIREETDFSGNMIARLDDTDVVIRQSSFHNCQNFSVASFNQLLQSSEPEYVKTTTNLLVEFRNKFGKNYCVIDITSYVDQIVEEAIKLSDFKVEYVVKAPYVNYNGSNMVLCILNLSNLKLIP